MDVEGGNNTNNTNTGATANNTAKPTKTPVNGVNGTGSRKSSPLPPTPTDDTPLVLDGNAYKEAGNTFFKQKKYKEAIEQYTKAIDLEPKNATFLSNRAAAYMSDGKYLAALNDCQTAERYNPGNPKTLLRMARIQTYLGMPNEALRTFDRITPSPSAKDKAPAVEMAQHLKTVDEVLASNGGGSMALIALDRAEKGLGYGVEVPHKWKLLRAEANLKMGNPNTLGEAQQIAMNLLRRNQQDPDALVLRGKILYAQGENSKAISMFQEALRCDPDMLQARKLLLKVRNLEKKKTEGNDAFKKGDYNTAVKIYTEALSLDPDNKETNAKLFSNRALAYNKVSFKASMCTLRTGLIPATAQESPGGARRLRQGAQAGPQLYQGQENEGKGAWCYGQVGGCRPRSQGGVRGKPRRQFVTERNPGC